MAKTVNVQKFELFRTVTFYSSEKYYVTILLELPYCFIWTLITVIAVKTKKIGNVTLLIFIFIRACDLSYKI